MDSKRLNQIITALNSKDVNQPCPRCSSSKFSVVGESEIAVKRLPSQVGLLTGVAGLGFHTTMPTIIVTCDNCGYISQHAQASLGLSTRNGLLGGLGDLK